MEFALGTQAHDFRYRTSGSSIQANWLGMNIQGSWIFFLRPQLKTSPSNYDLFLGARLRLDTKKVTENGEMWLKVKEGLAQMNEDGSTVGNLDLDDGSEVRKSKAGRGKSHW